MTERSVFVTWPDASPVAHSLLNSPLSHTGVAVSSAPAGGAAQSTKPWQSPRRVRSSSACLRHFGRCYMVTTDMLYHSLGSGMLKGAGGLVTFVFAALLGSQSSCAQDETPPATRGQHPPQLNFPLRTEQFRTAPEVRPRLQARKPRRHSCPPSLLLSPARLRRRSRPFTRPRLQRPVQRRNSQAMQASLLPARRLPQQRLRFWRQKVRRSTTRALTC